MIRELRLLRSIFEMARREWGYTALQNPIAGLRKPKAPEGRERRLKPGELQALTKACSTVAGSWLLHGFQLAIETGLRRGELLGIRWQHVRLDTAVLHVPVTKTDKARTIPLTDRAKAILTERRAECSTDAEYAFSVSANSFRLAWERCKRRAERNGCIGMPLQQPPTAVAKREPKKGRGLAPRPLPRASVFCLFPLELDPNSGIGPSCSSRLLLGG